ncbi:chondroitinase family polysaccharide lyase [uncultured Photobacterium sp.]|uniref:chondroitinase family polysaccharide lyase n=1 Tax=uncultured Photobacterium sp. TaxID=173973 RepID=UPI002638D10C|nr:chondroitinase family polysaccharide lyase [uncultured Photobacterium sp.]
MKNNKLSKLALLVTAAVVSGCSQSEAGSATSVTDTTSYYQPGGIMYFFELGLPETVSVSPDSTLSLSRSHFKDGSTSLEWHYEPGAKLTFSEPVGYKPFVANDSDQSQSTFSAWIYNPAAQDSKLTFEFGTNERAEVSFDINMSFTGWRHLLIPFSDMQGTPSEGMNYMQMSVPEGMEAGQIYLDQVMLSIPVDPRWPTRDAVAPYINTESDTAPNRHWLALYRYQTFLDGAKGDTAELPLDRQSIHTINQKLEEFALSAKAATPDLTQLRSQYGTYELTENDGVVTGKPLSNKNRLKIFLDKGVNKGLLNEEGFDTVFGGTEIRNYGEYMLELAKAMRSDIPPLEKHTLGEMYINLTRYALDQGLAASSGLGTAHHMGYSLRALFQAHFLSRDLLAENQLLDEVSEMMSWFSLTGRVYRPDSEMTNFNVDVMNTQLRGMLYSILMQPDEQIRAARLAQFSFWLSRSITNSYGLGGGFKRDGSIFHHAQHYPAYGKGALNGLTPVIEALSRTSYSVTPAAHEVVKHAVAMTEVYSNDALTLVSVNGRHPVEKQDIDLSPFRHMAMAGTPDGKAQIDTDMAGSYLRMSKKQDAFSRYLKKQGLSATAAPTGHWSMNFANLSIQRRDGWVAAVRGFSRYLVGNESYANANRYGRYINYGQLEIMGADGKQRAFSHDGWNWNRWPGTTAVQLPFNELRAKLRNVDSFSGLEEMLFSEQAYSGSLSHQDNGMFAMKLQGHPKYDASFGANKSVFFFDNRIVSLGSNIHTRDLRYPTQTTLFQSVLREGEGSVKANRQSVSEADNLTINRGIKPSLLVDPQHNAYFIPAGETVSLSVGEQQSVSQKDSKPTRGRFATAVLDHGKAPTDGKYEYAVLVDASKAEIEQFNRQFKSKQKPYLVKKQDKNAHIVWDRASNTTAYALFESSASIDDGLVKSTDSPVMVMVTPYSKQLSLSVVNPDLNLYQGKDLSQYNAQGEQKEVSIYSRQWKDNRAAPVTTKLVLKGKWKSLGKLPAGVELSARADGTTLLNVTTVRAEGVDIELGKI